jgi:hypothetical protein
VRLLRQSWWRGWRASFLILELEVLVAVKIAARGWKPGRRAV